MSVQALFDYIKGQGRLLMCNRDNNGNPDGNWMWLGDASNFEMGQAPEELKVKENYSGARANALTLLTGLDTTFSLTLRNLAPEVAALILAGTAVDVTSASVTNEQFPNPVVATVGAAYRPYNLKVPGKVSSLVITDSTGSPVTLVAGTDYEHDGYGLITFKGALTGLTQPFKAAYTAAAKSKVLIQNTAIQNKCLLFKGYNTARKTAAGGFARFDLLLYNCSLKPGETIGFIQADQIAEIPFNGSFDIDTTKAQTSNTSQFGELNYLDLT